MRLTYPRSRAGRRVRALARSFERRQRRWNTYQLTYGMTDRTRAGQLYAEASNLFHRIDAAYLRDDR